MQSWWRLALVVVAVAGAALGEDECTSIPYVYTNPNNCCKMARFKVSAFKPAIARCMQNYTMSHHDSGPPSEPPTPSVDLRNAQACIGECVFRETGLITSDDVLDKAAIAKIFTLPEPNLNAVISAAAAKCSDSYTSELDPSLECKTGAHEFQACLTKQLIINCPGDMATAASECDKLKATLTKCPMLPFIVHHNSKH